MSIELALGTPLADALNKAIQPKLEEVGWAGSAEDAALSEYIVLMVVNRKSQEEIATELAGDLLGLGPDDPAAVNFAQWLFDQLYSLNDQINGAAPEAGAATDAMEQDTDMAASTDGAQIDAPTGPKAMRNGNGNGNMRGGREKRLFGQMNKAMDRSHDSVLHRVRGNGNERINAHNRAPPTGPRGRGNNRMNNNRAAGITAGLNQMANGMPPMPGPQGMNGMNDMSWMMPGGNQQQELFHLLQQQNQMMAQLQQQIAQQNQNGSSRNGRSLFDRSQNPRGGRRGGFHNNGGRPHNNGESARHSEAGADGEDVDMSQPKAELPNAETTICKFNLACTNKDCKFAHQSPSAPPNTTVDVNDVCSFGAACKNWKCVGRHPSPAIKRAHQVEQECKFYPNCTNNNCPFKHPDMPPCRNGGDCNTMCKYTPCKNRFCPYKHAEGQRGTFPDKVWTADGSKNHVSDRKFVDGMAEEVVIPGEEDTTTMDATITYTGTRRHCPRAMISQRPEDCFIRLLRTAYSHATHRLTPRRLRAVPNISGTRCLSSQTRPRSPVRAAIEGRRLFGASILRKESRKQEYATSSENEKPREIAILGGGITGLTTAHYLARHAENAHITIYEASDTVGGWIKADRVDVEANGEKSHVLLQQGPRMLRSGASATKYDDLVLYDVLANLDMGDKIRHPETVSDNRYIYYPDHLVKLPTNALEAVNSWLREPLYNGTLKAAYHYWVQTNNLADPRVRFRPLTDNPRDETVLEFIERLTGDDQLAHNIVSGMFHGIYGGDIAKLSAKHTILENFWLSRQPGAYTGDGQAWMHWKDLYLLFDMLNGPNRLKVIELAENAVDTKLLAFEDGLLSLVEGLKKDLESQANVTFKYQEPVTALEHQDGQILLSTFGSTEPKKYDHAICTLFSKHLAEIAQPADSLPSLAETHAVTIMSVTFYYPNPNLLAEGGFGYLIPSSTPGNNEDALGVLFDSDLQTGGNEAPGTKLTVMLGGHYWDELDTLPTEKMGITMAKQEVITSVRLCEDCLPQHFLGHRDRMNKAHYELLSTFQGVIPAMRAGFDAAMRVARGHKQPWFPSPVPTPASELEDSGRGPTNWWERLQNPEHVFDHVGATGLEIFTEMEWATMYRGMKRDTLFRTFSQRELRFRDDEGKFLDVERRVSSNAPMRSGDKE
ncbi:hypothetical protein F5Y18DRAFT_417829 [Xylariaceae sp. FL1019]|nr:hypothetical protein F5Y18DRAFT_417829 [Xylariaceae sp. FL1019]